MPMPVEAFPWGSRSTTRTWWPASASAAPRLTAVVLLPTPPFWLAIAITLARPVVATTSAPGPSSGSMASTDAPPGASTTDSGAGTRPPWGMAGGTNLVEGNGVAGVSGEGVGSVWMLLAGIGLEQGHDRPAVGAPRRRTDPGPHARREVRGRFAPRTARIIQHPAPSSQHAGALCPGYGR